MRRVWLVEISSGDGRTWGRYPLRFEPNGRDRAGRVRPALVVQIDRANAVSPHIIIVPFTTSIRRGVLPSHALIPAGVGRLVRDSVVLCEQIRVIDKRRIIRVLGHVDDPCMEEVARALRTILGL